MDTIHSGHIAHYNKERRFGFIKSKGYHPEIFFHRTAIQDQDFTDISIGQCVHFKTYSSQGKHLGKIQAVEVWLNDRPFDSKKEFPQKSKNLILWEGDVNGLKITLNAGNLLLDTGFRIQRRRISMIRDASLHIQETGFWLWKDEVQYLQVFGGGPKIVISSTKNLRDISPLHFQLLELIRRQ